MSRSAVSVSPAAVRIRAELDARMGGDPRGLRGLGGRERAPLELLRLLHAPGPQRVRAEPGERERGEVGKPGRPGGIERTSVSLGRRIRVAHLLRDPRLEQHRGDPECIEAGLVAMPRRVGGHGRGGRDVTRVRGHHGPQQAAGREGPPVARLLERGPRLVAQATGPLPVA